LDEKEVLSNSILNFLLKIRTDVVYLPLKHIFNINKEQESFFSLISVNRIFTRPFEEHLEDVKIGKKVMRNSLQELIDTETVFLLFGDYHYKELSKVRFLLREVIIKKWVDECFNRFGNTISNIYNCFDLWKIIPERDSKIMREYREFYTKIGVRNCLYCSTQLTSNNYHLDHLIPWSRYPINRIWNLYPSCQSCNSQKSNLLLEFNEEIQEKVGDTLLLIIETGEIMNEKIIRDLQYLYKMYFKTQYVKSDKVKIEIIAYLKSVIEDLKDKIPGKRIIFNVGNNIK
jgi:hypothetical protein